MVAIKGAGENCVLITKTDESYEKQDKKNYLVVCDSIGSPVDTKFTVIDAVNIAMTANHLIIASDSYVHVWQYKQSQAFPTVDIQLG